MKKCLFPLLLALASFAALQGCAGSRAATRTTAEIPSRDPVPLNAAVAGSKVERSIVESSSLESSAANRAMSDSLSKTARRAGEAPARSIDPEASGAANSSGIRLVNSQADPSVPPSPDRSKTTPQIPPAATAATTAASEPSSPVMTLAELEEIALQHNPTLVQAEAEIDVDRGFLKQAGLYPNPQGGYYNASASNPSVKQSNGIFLSQEIVTAGKLGLAQQSILQEIKQMEWDREAQRMRVLNDLKIRYFEVLGAQQAVAIAGKLVTVAGESLELIERALAAKNASRPDVLQAKVQLETARLSLDEAEFRHTAAWEQLAVINLIKSRPSFNV